MHIKFFHYYLYNVIIIKISGKQFWRFQSDVLEKNYENQKKNYLFLLIYNNDTWLLVISWLALMLDAMLAVVFVTQAVGVDTQVAAVLGMQSLLIVTLVANRLFIMELDVVPLRLSSLTTTWTLCDCCCGCGCCCCCGVWEPLASNAWLRCGCDTDT